MPEIILDAIRRELTRQANENRPDTPFLDRRTEDQLLIDGVVDLRALANAVAGALSDSSKDEVSRP